MSTRNPEALLDSLTGDYHHLREEVRREGENDTRRRKLEAQSKEVREDFEKTVDRWVPDEEARDEWRQHFYHEGSRPDGLDLGEQPLFVGESDTGTSIEIRLDGDATVVFADGAHADRRPASSAEELKKTPRSLLDKVFPTQNVHETFGAPEAALDALLEHVEASESPPWEHAHELYIDGLIDGNFSLTGRGRRFVDSRTASRVEAGEDIVEPSMTSKTNVRQG